MSILFLNWNIDEMKIGIFSRQHFIVRNDRRFSEPKKKINLKKLVVFFTPINLRNLVKWWFLKNRFRNRQIFHGKKKKTMLEILSNIFVCFFFFFICWSNSYNLTYDWNIWFRHVRFFGRAALFFFNWRIETFCSQPVDDCWHVKIALVFFLLLSIPLPFYIYLIHCSHLAHVA